MLAPLDYFHLYPSLSKHFPAKGKYNTRMVASGVFLFLILLYNLSKPLFVIAYFKQMSPANLPGGQEMLHVLKTLSSIES